MRTKQCFKCGAEKPLTQFYKHSQMKDGHVNKCKECNKKDVRENRANKVGYYREYDRERANRPDRVKASAKYIQTESGKESRARSRKKWLERNVVKRAAHIVLGNAVRDGRVVKASSCEFCGADNARLEGHHDDYTQPLEVKWLCSKCHASWHKEHGEGLTF